MRRCVILILLAVVGLQLHAQEAVSDPSIRPLVMPFRSTEPKAEWLGELAAAAITRELRGSGVDAIGRAERLQAMDRLGVPSVPLLSHATVIRLASVLGATVAVVGQVDTAAGDLVLRARTIRVDTGYMGPEIVERGPRSDVFAIAARVGRAIAPSVGPTGTEGPRPPSAAFELFVRGLVASDPAAKAMLLTQALDKAPTLDEARFALWDVYSGQGEHQRARAAVQGVNQSGPDARRARFLAAVSDLQLGRSAEAAAALGELQRAMPTAALANDIGVAQLRKPGTGGARATELFREAATLDPTDADLFFNLGYAHWLAREYPQAVSALREAVRRDPTDEDAHYLLGVALQTTGASEEGAREKDLARRLSSSYAELEARRGANAVPRGLERLKTEIDASPLTRAQSALSASGQRDQRELIAFHLGNGRRLFDAGRDAEALTELRRVVFLSPYESEAHLLMGRILLRDGRPREAIDALKISVWSQESVPARLALAEAYIAVHEFGAARTELQAVLGVDAGNAAATKLLVGLPASGLP